VCADRHLIHLVFADFPSLSVFAYARVDSLAFTFRLRAEAERIPERSDGRAVDLNVVTVSAQDNLFVRCNQSVGSRWLFMMFLSFGGEEIDSIYRNITPIFPVLQ